MCCWVLCSVLVRNGSLYCSEVTKALLRCDPECSILSPCLVSQVFSCQQTLYVVRLHCVTHTHTHTDTFLLFSDTFTARVLAHVGHDMPSTCGMVLIHTKVCKVILPTFTFIVPSSAQKALPINDPVTLSSSNTSANTLTLTVTLLPAGHCPGSVM